MIYLVDIGADEQGLEECIRVGQIVLLDQIGVRGKPVAWAPCQCSLPGPCAEARLCALLSSEIPTEDSNLTNFCSVNNVATR